MKTEWIGLDKISTEGVQTRAGLRESAVQEYAQAIREDGAFEPAVVYRDGEKLHPAAGHHRLEAYRAAGKDKMPCIVREGTAWDAIKAGIKDNLRHRGERLTREDKRHNAELVLRRGPRMSDRAIAELVGLSPAWIGKLRHGMESTVNSLQSDVRVGRDRRAINTRNVGRNPVDERPKEDPGRGGTSVDLVQVDEKDVGLEAPAGGGATVDDAPEPTVKEIRTEESPLGLDEDLDWCRCGGPWESGSQGLALLLDMSERLRRIEGILAGDSEAAEKRWAPGKIAKKVDRAPLTVREWARLGKIPSVEDSRGRRWASRSVSAVLVNWRALTRNRTCHLPFPRGSRRTPGRVFMRISEDESVPRLYHAI